MSANQEVLAIYARIVDFQCAATSALETVRIANSRLVATNPLETVRAEPVEACSSKLRDAESASASSVFVWLCPSILRHGSVSGRTVISIDFGIDTSERVSR